MERNIPENEQPLLAPGTSGTDTGAIEAFHGSDGNEQPIAASVAQPSDKPDGGLPSETLIEWGVAYFRSLFVNLKQPPVAIGIGIVLFAAALRLWDLDTRAFHHDESLHAYYSWVLSDQGNYQHNPLMHGTFQFVATGLVFSVFGASDATARLLPALTGIAVVAVPLLLFRRELGEWGARIAAVLLAVSPGMLYFSRFARNDIYIVLWTLLLVWSLWRFLESPRPRYAYIATVVLAFSFATKELTYLVLLVLMSYLFLRVINDVSMTRKPSSETWPRAINGATTTTTGAVEPQPNACHSQPNQPRTCA